ncbi:beta-N-acetylglucosaminidase domain-containing protein, partial [Clostridium sp.]|uniref:beta-N-acetylglucosaminidase domain-containing protein n=1 Tax=Clostridium sp. TaxID=1506 RepID=UPI003F338373
KGLRVSYSNEVASDKTNIIIGIKNSRNIVDKYFNENISYNSETFNEEDSYVLKVDGSLSEKGTIAVLGKNTDSAYYGLATLKMIFNQLEGNEIRNVTFEDFADAKWRGFIEGFYGYPWSHEDRKSLMEFGGEFKMNSYIFAPKDDPYHNLKWRELYPENELAKIRELAEVGNKSKTKFVWAIHPGFNMINWNKYDEELETLLAKLEQLYSVGVRQFGLFMDDISTDQSLADKDKHVKLTTDVANWVKDKGDCYSLVYCPPYYNQAWTGEKGKPYLRALADLPENVEIMWTGVDVCGTANEKEMEWVREYIKRDSYMWLNWPVNGHNSARLMLGKGEVMEPGMHNVSGIVTNPLEYAELSKTAIFAVADYTWNTDEFNDDKSWEDSFKYIAPEVSEEFHIIASHLSDPSPSNRNLVLEESEYLKEDLKVFLDSFNIGGDIKEVGLNLVEEFDKILNAIDVFKSEKNTNIKMKEEIKPWLGSLEYITKSCKSVVKSAIALKEENLNEAWTELSKATSYNEKSKTFTTKKLNYPDVVVESGAKRLIPFATELINKLDSQIYLKMDPEASSRIPMASYNSNELDKMVDGNNETFAYFKVRQKIGDWYGVDLGKVININDIEIIQGRTDTDHDRFHRGILEYSLDGENWTAIGEEREGIVIKENNLNIKGRYIRYRATFEGVPGGKPDLWTSVREITINKGKDKAVPYTNVNGLKDITVSKDGLTTKLEGINNITLNKNEYIGIKLTSIERIAEILCDVTSEDLTLESSINGIEWNKVNNDESLNNARYLRLINNTNNEITFDLNILSIKNNMFEEKNASHNFGSVYSGDIKNIFDKRLESKVWFGAAQSANNYVKLDLGGVIDIETLDLIISDSEKDYFREGNIQISLDGENWETVGGFKGGSREENFPTLKPPYRYKTVENINKKGRYIRLISTKNSNAWLALNEILVNGGKEELVNQNPAFEVKPQGESNASIDFTIDNKLSTFYTPGGNEKEGELLYKISNYTDIGELIILQSPTGISNANVEVRDINGWNTVGSLSESYNSFNLSKFENVLEVKLTWTEEKPIINEIITVKKENESEDNIIIDKIKNLVCKNIDNSKVELSWNKPNNVSGLVGFVIFKDGKVLKEIGAEETAIIVDGLRANTIYGFKVASKYSNGAVSKTTSINIRTSK